MLARIIHATTRRIVPAQARRIAISCSSQVSDAAALNYIYANKTVVMFGAAAPSNGSTTSKKTNHPPFTSLAADMLQAGADEIICYSPTDPHVRDGGRKSLESYREKIKIYEDPGALFAKAYGLDGLDKACSMGLQYLCTCRNVSDGRVQKFQVVTYNKGEDASTVLVELKELEENEAIEAA